MMARGNNWDDDDGPAILSIAGIDPHILERFENLVARRGTTPQRQFETMVRSFDRGSQTYELGMRIDFGKYAGMELEDVIRTDPRYISWLSSVSEWFKLGTDATRLLKQVEA